MFASRCQPLELVTIGAPNDIEKDDLTSWKGPSRQAHTILLADESRARRQSNFSLEHILKTSEENDHTSEVQETDVVLDEVVVARGNAAELPQPGKQPFDLPTPSVAAQFALVLGWPMIQPVGRDQFHAPFPEQLFIQRIAVVGLVADEARRQLL